MMIDSSLATYHSIVRSKERAHRKNLRSAEKNISLALQRGKEAEDFSSWERTFLSGKGHDSQKAIAYNQFCYIFSDEDVCITLYRLPAWFGRKKPYHGKERIRDIKKYQRYCVDESRMDYER